MKFLTKFIFIIVIFLKTGNLLSDDKLFNVNNIILDKKVASTSNKLNDEAIKVAFNTLIKKILLTKDLSKVTDLSLNEIKELVAYYNISEESDLDNNKVNYSVKFNKSSIHNLFYKREISYSDIDNKEFFILPILLQDNEFFIFSNNYFYENWNKTKVDEQIEFILPLENIEIIQKVNKSRSNLSEIDLNSVFNEYQDKNIAIIFIDDSNLNEKKVFLNSRIQNKIISKNFIIKKKNDEKILSNNQIILSIKEQITNLVKSQNLINLRTPSFLNVKLNLDDKNNLVLINSRIRNIHLIENIFILKFNKDEVYLKIKFLGKIEKLSNELKNENITLKLINDEWYIKVL